MKLSSAQRKPPHPLSPHSLGAGRLPACPRPALCTWCWSGSRSRHTSTGCPPAGTCTHPAAPHSVTVLGNPPYRSFGTPHWLIFWHPSVSAPPDLSSWYPGTLPRVPQPQRVLVSLSHAAHPPYTLEGYCSGQD
eukprot:900486-Rhodomonas_salina.1